MSIDVLDGLEGRLKAARADSGMTQEEAAKAAGIDRVTLSRYEMGESTPNSRRITRLAIAYGVSLTWLLTGAGEWKEQAS